MFRKMVEVTVRIKLSVKIIGHEEITRTYNMIKFGTKERHQKSVVGFVVTTRESLSSV